MTDKQAQQITYAILGGALIIALAIRPWQFSLDNFLIGLAVAILIFVLLGFFVLIWWLHETKWLLPIAIAAVVVTAFYFGRPVVTWLTAGPAQVTAIASPHDPR